MAEPHRYLNTLRDVFNTGANMYSSASKKAQNIQNALLGVSALGKIFTNFKKARYQDMMDTVNMDNWIQLGKTRANIAKLKSEHDTFVPFFEKAKADNLLLSEDSQARQLFSKSVYENTIGNNDKYRTLNLTKDYPTIEVFRERKNDINKTDYDIINRSYEENLKNMVARARGIQEFDPELMDEQFNALKNYKMEFDIENLSLIDAMSNNIGKRIKNVDQKLDQFRSDYITGPTSKVKKSLERLVGISDVEELRKEISKAEPGVLTRIPRGYHELIQQLPPFVREEIYDSVTNYYSSSMKLNDKGQSLNNGPSAQDLSNKLKTLIGMPNNVTEGANKLWEDYTNRLTFAANKWGDTEKFDEIKATLDKEMESDLQVVWSLSGEEAADYIRERNIKDVDLTGLPKGAKEFFRIRQKLEKSVSAEDLNSVTLSLMQLNNRKPTESENQTENIKQAMKFANTNGMEMTTENFARLTKDKKLRESYGITLDQAQSMNTAVITDVYGKGNTSGTYNSLIDEETPTKDSMDTWISKESTFDAHTPPLLYDQAEKIKGNLQAQKDIGRVFARLENIHSRNQKTEFLGENSGVIPLHQFEEWVVGEIIQQYSISPRDRLVSPSGELFPGKELEEVLEYNVDKNNYMALNKTLFNENLGLQLIEKTDPNTGQIRPEIVPTKKYIKKITDIENPEQLAKELNSNLSKIREQFIGVDPYTEGDDNMMYEEISLNFIKEVLKNPNVASKSIQHKRIVSQKGTSEVKNFDPRYYLDLRDPEAIQAKDIFYTKYKNPKDLELWSKLQGVSTSLEHEKVHAEKLAEKFGRNLGAPGSEKYQPYERILVKKKALESYFDFVNGNLKDDELKNEIINDLKELNLW